MAGVSWLGYAGSSGVWNRTLQNWQSEFLAVGSMAVLSIYLRQRGSPESSRSARRTTRPPSKADRGLHPNLGGPLALEIKWHAGRKAATTAPSHGTAVHDHRSARV